jgi:thiol-disulfide isomerase/thioredoxin
MMKNIIPLVLFMVASMAGYSQTSDAKPGSPIPAFKMLRTNNTYYSEKEIPKNKPFVLIYFAPDCDHCLKLMDDLFKRIHELDKATVVLVTFKPVNDLPAFEKKYQVAKYPNIKVGTEGTAYVLRNYYHLDTTPFTAMYDKRGKLTFSYKNEPPVNEFFAHLKKL